MLTLPPPELPPSPIDQGAILAPPEPSNPQISGPAPAKTPLQLLPEQEKLLLDDTLLRLCEIRREMGLTNSNEVIPQSWMWARKCHEAYYQGDFSPRLAMGGIFPRSNYTLGSGSRHVGYVSSRVADDLLGTTPFMAALGRNPENEALAKQLEEYIQSEIDRSTVRSALREAQRIALIRNECIVKIGYVSDYTAFIGEATVLVDDATGEPIKTPDKQLFIFEDDNFTENPNVAGLMMLEPDPSFSITQNQSPGLVTIPAYTDAQQQDFPERIGRYQYFEALPQKLCKKEGVNCVTIDYRSFLCPLRVESIHDADCCAHVYLESPLSLKRKFGNIDVSQDYFAWWNQPGQDKPKWEQGENNQPTTAIYQQCVVAEVFRRCDPDGTGEDKELFMVLDLTNERIIYRDYLANHMAKRPFECVPGLERVAGRWYGKGVFGKLEDHLLYEDGQWNRANFKNSKAASITVADQSAVKGWESGMPPVIGTDDIFWLNPNWNPEGNKQVIQRINLAEPTTAEDIEMMKTCRQSADSMIGAISTSSANESDFNQSKTATGNQLVQQASDVQTKAIEQEQADAINDVLAQVVDVILEHMDRKKMIYMKRTSELVTLNRNECRSLSMQVRLLLTRSRSTQLLATSQQGLLLGKDYFALMRADPEQAKVLREQYINEAKALEVDDADHLFPEISDQMIADWKANQKPPAPMVNHSISAKLEDFLPSERPQAVQSMGITPGTPDEAAQVAAQADAKEVAMKAASKPTPTTHDKPNPSIPV